MAAAAFAPAPGGLRLQKTNVQTVLTLDGLQQRRRLLAAAGTALLGGAAFAQTSTTPSATPPTTPAPLRVVASFSILADLAREVGGSAVVVHSLVGADADAHHFSPKPQHAQQLARAELVVVNGLGFEGWLDRLVSASGYRGPVLVVTEGLQPRRAGATADPHFWHDLVLTQHAVGRLQQALSAARPAQAALFAKRAGAYQQQLQALHLQTLQRLAAVATDRRRVVSPHDAFGYLGAAYGIEFLPVRVRASGGEASAAEVARLIALLRQKKAQALFVENISDPRLLERIAREAGVSIGGRLYSDALSAPGTEADSYLKLMRHNTQALVAALTAVAAAAPTR